MIHVLTVHWKDPMWIDIQLAYLKTHINAEFKVYAFLNDIPTEYNSKFFYTSTENIIEHSIKLNILADIAIFNSENDSDILLFIDGDAFPIAPLDKYIDQGIKNSQLIAIQRKENNGDIQPHPCFCATTVGFWKKIQGDWNEGYKWKDSNNNLITDVGGNLLEKLNNKNISWKKILRSNTLSTHPLWFGVYDNIIYHHGSGFREPVSREDSKLLRSVFRSLIPKAIQNKLKQNIFAKKAFRVINSSEKMKKISNDIYEEIKTNTNFYKKL